LEKPPNLKPLLGLILSLLMLAACAGDPAEDTLTIATAASVRALVEEIANEYSSTHPIRIHVTSGSTGELARQVREGARIDIFFGADIATAESLHAVGLAHGDVIPYATGQLVLWQHPEARPRIATLADLDKPAVTIAIANPEMAPYGAAARAILQREGRWTPNIDRIVQANNVEQAFQFANTRNVTAAFISRSLVPTGHSFLTLAGPESRIQHGAIIVRHSDTPPRTASAFLDHFLSPHTEPTLHKYGFASPEPPSPANQP
jgi:molybdate transport system substrate-binding protein